MSTQKLERKPINFSNILLGAGLNLVEYVHHYHPQFAPIGAPQTELY